MQKRMKSRERFVFNGFSFSESEMLDLAKNYNYLKFQNEGSLLLSFTPKRLDTLISAGFLIYEPDYPTNDSFMVSEVWRKEFKEYLETSSFPKEIADTIRRGY